MKNTVVCRPGIVRPARLNRLEARRASRTRRLLSLETLEEKTLLSGGGTLQGILPPSSGGTFTAITNAAPDGVGLMMLETDGSVLVQGTDNLEVSKQWYRMVPNATGSYVAGTWTQEASMSLQRLYFGSAVLPDGRVIVQGGEYSGASGASNDANSGEIYNPVTNTWSSIATFPQTKFGDDPVEVLADGTVLAGYLLGAQTYIYNASTNQWSTTGTKLDGDSSDEEAWEKLPDGSILSYDIFVNIGGAPGKAQRYLPSSGTWVEAGSVPVSLSTTGDGYELGPGFVLPDGRVIQFGANGNTAYYTESTNSWTTGPSIPSGYGMDDAPGAELPDGKILLIADTPLFNGPSHLYEFDPVAGTYTDLTSQLPSGFLGGASYGDRMLVLPTGQVMISNGGSRPEVFTPTPDAAASTPTISTVSEPTAGTFALTGTAINGISEGAAYGDDALMATNYPIINFTDTTTGKVYYSRTFGWTSQVAAVGSTTPETTNFSLPAGLPVDSYNVVVSANGSPSAPLLETNPTIVNVASASPNPVTGTTASLSVLGGDALGESSLTYTWSTTSQPNGAKTPTFSANGTNAAKNDGVTFYQAGNYTFSVTMKNAVGLTTTTTFNVVVNQTVTTLAISPKTVTVPDSGTQQFAATATDQFGATFTPSATYTVAAGGVGGTISSTGLYTAPATGFGTDTVTVTSGSVHDTATVNVTPPLYVTAFVPTSTGFTATFNEAINPATLNLYTTAANNLGPADVTLVGASTGPVTGSLIVGADDKSVTFVQTGGILPPDTYTVTLRSAADGFVDPSGNTLDGGQNYTTTFTVAPTTARVIALPSFARGPGQAVNVPAAAGGLPLTISDGTGVTSISLTITYNTALLTITGANLGAGAPAGSSVVVNTSTPGSAILTFTSPTALPAGLANFASLIASVPDTAPYSDKEDLVIGGISLNGGAIAGTDADAVHLVAYLGDSAGLGGYSSQDVTLLRRVLAGTDTGFGAYPLADPTIVSDIVGLGYLNSQDVTALRQLLAGSNVPQIPAVPNVTVAQGADPKLWVPRTLAGTPGSTVTVPVMFQQTNATPIGLDAANVAIGFDPALFTVAGVRLGNIPAGFTLSYTVAEATGEVLVTARSASGAITLQPGAVGTLVLVDLAIRPGAPSGAATIGLLGDVRVGRQVFSTSLNDGHLTLTPAPTDSGLSPIDGMLTIAPGSRTTVATSATSAAPSPAVTGPDPVAVDRAIEAIHGTTSPAGTEPSVVLALASPAALIPWTNSGSTTGLGAAAQDLINPTRPRASKVTVAQAIPASPTIGR